MVILVTGVAGFIGSYVAKALIDRGDQVIGIDNFNSYYNPKLKEARINDFLDGYDLKLYRLDLADFSGLKKVFSENRMDKICRLGAQAGVRYSLENPELYIQSNIVGTHNLLELAKQNEVKDFIFASSASVYGGNTKVPFSESDPVTNPVSVYAATKRTNELQAHVYYHLFSLNCFGLRFFTVYGPWGRPDMALFKFTKAILEDEPIDVYNYGKMKRDFTFITDIVEGVIKALDNVKGYEIFNLGNSKTVELTYFIECIEKELHKTARKNLLPLQQGDVPETFAEIEKTKKILGWEPKVSIEQGVKEFIKWYKEYHKIR